jgi:tetratricopeptide (TPR) repeat protein
MLHTGEAEAACALFQQVLAAREGTWPADDEEVLNARHNLAIALAGAGDLEAALALEERVLAARERVHAAGDRDILRTLGTLASMRSGLGDLAGARALSERALAGYERMLPADHIEVAQARGAVLLALARAGDSPAVGELLRAQVSTILGRASSALCLSPREAGEMLGRDARRAVERFYTYLWVEERSKAEALWKAKCDLRARGQPPADWAGWVLSGDPD